MLLKNAFLMGVMGISSSWAVASDGIPATICGQLEADEKSGYTRLLLDSEEDRTKYAFSEALVFPTFQPPYAREDYAKEQELSRKIHALTGNRVCLSHVLPGSWEYGGMRYFKISVTRQTEPTLAPAYRPRDVASTHCEIFIDKAATTYVDGYSQRTDHYPVGTLHLFIKLHPELLDGTVRTVRYYGKADLTGSFRSLELTPFAGAHDYFELKLPAHVPNEGAFYVETEHGTRYWLNANLNPGENFRFTREWIQELERAVGFFGYKYPKQGPELDVGSLPRTADAFRSANPQACR